MKVAVLGAGGVRTPLLVQSFITRQHRLALDELVLMDVDAQRLELMACLSTPMEQARPRRFTITRTTELRSALTDADFVITTFRVGDMAGRAIDERVALNHGVLGQETTGPGGFAMGLRTLPVLLEVVALMREVCPEAWLINFANPAGLLAEAIVNHAQWPRAVGICDAPTGLRRELAGFLHIAPAEVFLEYAGLNHLGWVKGLWHSGRNRLPDLLEKLAQGEVRCPPFEPSQVLALGMWPNEYLYYYYSDAAVPNLLKAGRTRGEQLLELNIQLLAELERARAAEDIEQMQRLFAAYHRARGETYFAAETGRPVTLMSPELNPSPWESLADEGYAGVALNVIEALLGQAPQILTLNVANRGAVSGMLPEDVVEVPCWVSRHLIRPLAMGALPDPALDLMQQVKIYERLTIEATLERSYVKALAALSQHPLVPSPEIAQAILDDYIEQHGALLPIARPQPSTSTQTA